MTHQGLGADVVDNPFERLPPAWRTCHHLGVNAVQPSIEAVEMVESSWRVDQSAGLIHDLAVAYFHHANRTRRAAVGVGSLEVDCGEVESHYRTRFTGWTVLCSANSAGTSAGFSPSRPPGIYVHRFTRSSSVVSHAVQVRITWLARATVSCWGAPASNPAWSKGAGTG